MLKSLVSKFHHNLSVRLKDIAEKQVPMKLKPIVPAWIRSLGDYGSLLLGKVSRF